PLQFSFICQFPSILTVFSRFLHLLELIHIKSYTAAGWPKIKLSVNNIFFHAKSLRKYIFIHAVKRIQLLYIFVACFPGETTFLLEDTNSRSRTQRAHAVTIFAHQA
ncbi:hypothetical protein RU07_17595, partial [Agrobacterium tumefaciens]